MGETPRWVRVLFEHLAATELEPGTVHHVEVRHDDDCAVWDGQDCDCEPDVESGERIDRKYGGDT